MLRHAPISFDFPFFPIPINSNTPGYMILSAAILQVRPFRNVLLLSHRFPSFLGMINFCSRRWRLCCRIRKHAIFFFYQAKTSQTWLMDDPRCWTSCCTSSGGHQEIRTTLKASVGRFRFTTQCEEHTYTAHPQFCTSIFSMTNPWMASVSFSPGPMTWMHLFTKDSRACADCCWPSTVNPCNTWRTRAQWGFHGSARLIVK